MAGGHRHPYRAEGPIDGVHGAGVLCRPRGRDVCELPGLDAAVPPGRRGGTGPSVLAERAETSEWDERRSGRSRSVPVSRPPTMTSGRARNCGCPRPERAARAEASHCGHEIVLEPRLVTPGDPAGVRFLHDIDVVTLVELAPAFRQVPDLYDACVRRAGPWTSPPFSPRWPRPSAAVADIRPRHHAATAAVSPRSVNKTERNSCTSTHSDEGPSRWPPARCRSGSGLARSSPRPPRRQPRLPLRSASHHQPGRS